MIRLVCCLVVWLRNSYLYASQSSVHNQFLKKDKCIDQMILYLKVQVVPKSAEPSELQDIPPAPLPSTQTSPAATEPMAPSPNTITPVETPPPYHEIYPSQASHREQQVHKVSQAHSYHHWRIQLVHPVHKHHIVPHPATRVHQNHRHLQVRQVHSTHQLGDQR